VEFTKIIIMSSITHPYVVPKDFSYLRNKTEDILMKPGRTNKVYS